MLLIVFIAMSFFLTLLVAGLGGVSHFRKKEIQRLSQEKEHWDAYTEKIQLDLKSLQKENHILQGNLGLSEGQRKQQEENLKKMEEFSQQMKQMLKLEFSNLSSTALKEQTDQFRSEFHERSENFQKASEERLLGYTRPLRDQLAEFREQINKYQDSHLMNEGRLKERIEDLQKTTQTLSEAFSKNKKIRGDWGEQQLTLVLEQSGLTRDIHFHTQKTLEGSEANQQRPDVLLSLPGERHLIIDAKTPFDNYERMLNAASEEEEKSFRSTFIDDVKMHIKDLSSKDYPQASKKNWKSLDSPPVIFLFLPIESAFLLAMGDVGVQKVAQKALIMLCSPQTLFGVSKTIAHIWELYQQDRNSLEILKLSKTIIQKTEKIYEHIGTMDSSLRKAQETLSQLRTPYIGKGGILYLKEKIDSLGSENSSSQREEKTSGILEALPPLLETPSSVDTEALDLFEEAPEIKHSSESFERSS